MFSSWHRFLLIYLTSYSLSPRAGAVLPESRRFLGLVQQELLVSAAEPTHIRNSRSVCGISE